MTSTNGNGRPDRAALLQVAAAQRVASALVVAFGVCEDWGTPLSQQQMIALIQAALLEFDGFAAQLSSLASLADLLGELGDV